jgi:SH3-like domain-containing protein
MPRPLILVFCLLILSSVWAPFGFLGASSAYSATVGKQTGLPVPRYVSLRSGEVNVRAGPGSRYPIEWVFKRRSLPVEVVAEFDTWRKIRDFEGTEGWVHQSMLSGRRTIQVIGQVRTLRRDPGGSAPAVARMEPGVLGNLEDCQHEWCEIRVSGLSGWVSRAHIWGVDVKERLDD